MVRMRHVEGSECSTDERKEECLEHLRGKRVLLHGRPGMSIQKGGDTVLLEQYRVGLTKFGIEVTVDESPQPSLEKVDIVHLFNFALPELLKSQALCCVEKNIPFVVTTLNEEVGLFHSKSHRTARLLTEYVLHDQDKSWYSHHESKLPDEPSTDDFDNSWVVSKAARLLVTGPSEALSLRKLYGSTLESIDIVPVGVDVMKGSVAAFEQEYGVRDFVLCVGRLESRKNQLMLLKALEQSDLPIVLVGGGFTYQPEYAEAVKRFRRRGSTLLLGRLSHTMLGHAYAAARVHALPSWYELPGLVSLEAALQGCSIVGTRNGSLGDYCGDEVFYCDPEDEHSVLHAVYAAYYSPLSEDLSTQLKKYSVDVATRKLCEVYSAVLQETSPRPIVPLVPGIAEVLPTPTVSFGVVSSKMDEALALRLLEDADLLAKQGSYNEARDLYLQVNASSHYSLRAQRSIGAMLLVQNDLEGAYGAFLSAHALDASDRKSRRGMALVLLKKGEVHEAIALFRKLLLEDPFDLATLYSYMEACYAIQSHEELSNALQRYVQRHPDSTEMQYCLAGCLFKEERYAEAKECITQLISREPSHKSAQELLSLISERISSRAIAEAQVSSKVDALITTCEREKKEGLFESVVSRGKEALEKEALSSEHYEMLSLLVGESLTLLAQTDEAHQYFKECLEKNPKCARAWCGKGALLAYMESWGDADEAFIEALRHNPRSDVAYAGRGLCARQKGALDRAWEYFTTACSLNPGNKRAVVSLIELAYALSRLSDLEGILRKFLLEYPSEVEFRYALAGCLFHQRKLEESSLEVAKIKNMAPGHTRTVELEVMVDHMRESITSEEINRKEH
jgi:tetratricopeptide (TPR) repeat protein/glycosyltransferase involved in cell wall biosynthesis